MTPVQVARYVKCFQLAAQTRKVKSRLVRRDGNYDDNVAELIRAVLPRDLFRMVRRRRGYELAWQGAEGTFTRLVARLPLTVITLRAAGANTYRRNWITPPYDLLLEEAVVALPILNRFRQDEARRMAGEPVVEQVPEHLEPGGHDPDGLEEEDIGRDDADEAPLPVTPAVPPAAIAAEIAARMQERRQELVETNVDFPTDGARRFAAALARATRGR